MEEKNKKGTEEYHPIVLDGFNRMLCRIAGSDLHILSDPKCSHEISRHARIGAIIISTALLASVSMFFAIQTISQSLLTGLLAGLVWGAAIFILDSYIIASYKKNDNKWLEFKLILPRLILAFILGCSISIPLELKFFSTEINDELVSMKAERQIENQATVNIEYTTRLNPFLQERQKLENNNKQLRLEITHAAESINMLNDKMAQEKGGTGFTGLAGEGSSYKDLESQRDYIKKTELPQLMALDTPRIAANLQRINEIDKQIATLPKPTPDSVKFTGLSSQMDALKRLTGKNGYVWFAYWIFFFLILGMETAPIFVKLFSPKGSYDEILAMNEYEVMLKQKKRQSDLHELINAEVAAIRSINIKKGIAQEAINEKIMSGIADAQSDIAEKAIRIWHLEQLQKVEDNVGDFIKSKI
jgi:Domain of unknown function (DUF4407)